MTGEKVIHRARVLHDGWEMDNELWVVELPCGSREARMTSHGMEFTASMADIDEKINETQASLSGLVVAKMLVEKRDIRAAVSDLSDFSQVHTGFDHTWEGSYTPPHWSSIAGKYVNEQGTS